MTIADTTTDYYHINRLVQWSGFDKWSAGDEIDIGGESNPYFRFFETQQKVYGVNTDKGHVPVSGVHFINSVASGEIQCPDIANIASDLVRHFVAYIRELIWEDIRKAEFPHLPSRQRCIWLIPNREGVKFWINRLGAEQHESQVARVRLQGRLHIGSDEHLLGDSEPMAITVKRARQYWLGINNDEANREILFEGRVKVQDVVPLRDFA